MAAVLNTAQVCLWLNFSFVSSLVIKTVTYYLCLKPLGQYYQKVALIPLTRWVCTVKEGYASACLDKGRVA